MPFRSRHIVAVLLIVLSLGAPLGTPTSAQSANGEWQDDNCYYEPVESGDELVRVGCLGFSDEGHDVFISEEVALDDDTPVYYVYDYEDDVETWYVLGEYEDGTTDWVLYEEAFPEAADTTPADADGAPDSGLVSEGDAWTPETLVEYTMENLDDYWRTWFEENELDYEPPTLDLSESPGTEECVAEVAYYCAGGIYLETEWVDYWLEEVGDFGLAQVVAHEFGHHVEALLGWEWGTQEEQIAFELGADCFAGVWANSTYFQGILEDGDLDEGLSLLLSVGDDFQGANPDEYTHGTSEQRQDSFMAGYESADSITCMETG